MSTGIACCSCCGGIGITVLDGKSGPRFCSACSDSHCFRERGRCRPAPTRVKAPKATKRVRETVGVQGSLHRRILELCEALGLVLVDVESFEDVTGLRMRFDDGEHVLTDITIRDRLRPEEWERR